MGPRKKAVQGPAAEAIGFRINEGPTRPRPLPFTAMYVGEGVVTVEGVGVFARWTRASVDAATAARLRGDPAWEVTPAGPGGRGPAP
jgi:hypothetical protein